MKRNIVLILLLFVTGAYVATAQTDKKVTIHNDENGTDEDIDLPEAMTIEADSLLKEWSAKKYLVPDTNCANPDVNPYFDTDVYKARLRKLPTVMEMPYNPVVQKFIDQYSGRLRKSVSYMLGASNFYVPIFEEALDRYNLPLELKYLPVIESAFNPFAVSRVGAVGLWQFMLKTAKRYNLQVNSLVDERRDPIKSSEAAAHYLSDLYKIYGDWSLVIAAYNCGPNIISRAMHRAGGAKDYWRIYPYLPAETRGYVPAFIAANYIMNYYCEHNICPMKATIPLTTDTVVLNRDVYAEQIAAYCKIDMEEIRALNPQYKTNLFPGSSEPSTLCLPQDLLNTFIDARDSVYTYRLDELTTKREEVEVKEPQPTRSYSRRRRHSRRYTAPQKQEEVVEQPKEEKKEEAKEEPAEETRTTSSRSSRRHSESSSRSSKKSKSSDSRSSKRSGKSSKSKSSKSKSSKSSKKTKKAKEVTIGSGESLSTIAEKHHTTVSKLKKLNKINGSTIKAGKKLKVK